MTAQVRILGTSHISRESIKQIKKEFLEFKPDIVAVELDQNRLHALLNNSKPSYSPKMISKIGLSGYLFAVIGGIIQRKLGSLVNIKPGSEMLTAVKLAHKNFLKIALIDRPIHETLSRFSKRFKFKTKMKMLKELLSAPFEKEKIKLRLDKTPSNELVTKVLGEFEKKYPELHDVLVNERNKYMANNVIKLINQNPESKILVVIGAGHVPGIKEIFSKKFKNTNKENKNNG